MLNFRIVVAWTGRALLDPACEDSVRFGGFVYHLAALVPDCSRWLGDEQAACRGRELDAPTPVLPGDVVMVSGRIVSVKTEPKSPLTG